MANPTTSTKDFGHSTGEQFKEKGGQVADKAKEAASGMASKAKEAVSAVGDMVSDAASSVGSTISKSAERATTATGSGVRHLGETIKEKGPQEGMFGGATRAVADTLSQGGKYLEQEGFNGMMEDVTELVRRNPMPAVLLGIGLGFLLGRTLRS